MKQLATALILAAIVSPALADGHLTGWQADMDRINSLRHDPNPGVRHCAAEMDDDMWTNEYFITAGTTGRQYGGWGKPAADYHRKTYIMPWFENCVRLARGE